MKKSFIVASLALITPAIIVPISTEASAVNVQSVLYSSNGENVAVDFETFTAALNAGVLTNLDITYIQMNNSFYSFDTLTNAMNAFDTPTEAFTFITSDASFQQSITNVVEGTFNPDSGSFVGTANQESKFEIISIE